MGPAGPGGGRSQRRSALRWAAAALFLALTVASLGAFFNDEVLQAIAYENLLDGHLTVQERPDHLWQITKDVRFDVRLPKVVGDHVVPNGSPLLDFAALPVGWLLLLVDRLVPVRLPLLAAWAFLGHKTSRWGLDAVLAWWGRSVPWTRTVGGMASRSDPARGRTGVPVWMLWAWMWTALAAWGAIALPPLDLRHWVSFVALGLTNALLFAATAGLLWLLARRALAGGAGADADAEADAAAAAATRTRLAGLTVVLFLLSPALFWAAGQKYHTAQALLAVAAALLYHEGVTRGREGLVLGAAAVGGLAVFSNEMGVAVLGAVGLAHAATLSGWGGWSGQGGPDGRSGPDGPDDARVVASWRWRDWRHVLAFGASAVAGLVPWIVHDTLLGVAPWSPRTPGAVVGDAAGAVSGRYQFTGPLGLLGNLWDAHLDAGHFEGHPAAVLVIAPWVLAALVGLVLPRKTPGLRLVALHVALTWLVVGPRLPTQGSGFDPRFLSGLWPGYALLAAGALGRVLPASDAAAWRRTVRLAAGTAVVVLAGVLAVLAWMAATHFLLGPADGTQVSVAQRWVGRVALLLVALFGAVAVVHRPLRPTLPVLLGLSLVPALLWLVDALLVHHRRLPGMDGADTVAFLTPVGHWLWDLAWDWLVPCEGRYVCTVR